MFKIILHLLLCTFIGRQDISQLLSLTKAKPEPRPGVNNWYQSKNKETKEEEDGMAHTDEEVNVNMVYIDTTHTVKWPREFANYSVYFNGLSQVS